MDPVKILHCADLHIENESKGNDLSVQNHYSDLLKGLRQIVSLANEEEVDILLIAGDLFDTSAVDTATLNSVKESLSDCQSYVFISPGNHDYVSVESPYHDDEGWPEDTFIFKNDWESFELPDLNTVVWGAAFQSTHVEESLIDVTADVDRDKINLCCIHGDLVSNTAESNYHPIIPDHISTLPIDYLALGHIHKRCDVQEFSSTFYAYPGNPVGRGFDELGPRGVYLGFVGRGRADLDFYPIAERHYLVEEIDISNLVTEREILARVREELEARYGEDWKKHYYRLIFTGEGADGQLLSWTSIKDQLSDELAYLEIQDRTVVSIDLDSAAEENTLQGAFIRNALRDLEKKQDEEEEERIQRALKYGLEALTGGIRLDED